MIIMVTPVAAAAAVELAVKVVPVVLAAAGLLPCTLIILLRGQIF